MSKIRLKIVFVSFIFYSFICGNTETEQNSKDQKSNEHTKQNLKLPHDSIYIKELTMRWNELLVKRDLQSLGDLYADQISFYGYSISKAQAMSSKREFFNKYDDFNQKIIGDVIIKSSGSDPIDIESYIVTFPKQTTFNNITTTVVGYLIFEKFSDKWRIVNESDDVTNNKLSENELMGQSLIDELRPKSINFDFFKFRDYRQNIVFDVKEALAYLFPGNLYNQIDVDKTVYLTSSWKCEVCPKKDSTDFSSNDNTIPFPWQINYTSVLKQFYYITDKDQFIYLFFNTREIPESAVRYFGGFLGVAVFHLENDNWKLTDYDPAIECIGNWSTAPKPKEILNLGRNRTGIYIKGFHEKMAMEDYDPFYSYIYIYSKVQNKFQVIFFEDNTLCKNWDSGFGTEWESKLNILLGSQSEEYNKLQLVTEGVYDPNYIDENGFIPDLKDLIKNKDKVGFKLIRTYTFNGTEYELESKELKIN